MSKEDKKNAAVNETVAKVAKFMDPYTYSVVREDLNAALGALFEAGFEVGESQALEDLSTPQA